jgi:hypothetical protein
VQKAYIYYNIVVAQWYGKTKQAAGCDIKGEKHMRKVLLISTVLVFSTAAFCQTEKLMNLEAKEYMAEKAKNAKVTKQDSVRPCVPDAKAGKVCPAPDHPKASAPKAASNDSAVKSEDNAAKSKEAADRIVNAVKAKQAQAAADAKRGEENIYSKVVRHIKEAAKEMWNSPSHQQTLQEKQWLGFR